MSRPGPRDFQRGPRGEGRRPGLTPAGAGVLWCCIARPPPPRSQRSPPPPPELAQTEPGAWEGAGGPERAADVTRAQHTVSGVCRGSAPPPQRLKLTRTAFSLPWALMALSLSGPSGNKAKGAVLPGSHALVVSWTLGTSGCRPLGTRRPIACTLRCAG